MRPTHDHARVEQIRDAIARQALNRTFSTNNNQPYVMDANGTMFGARQLEYIESQIYRTEYASYKAREIFPLESGGGQWTDFFTYKVMDYQGKATRLNPHNSNNIPEVGLSSKEVRNPIRHVAASYGYGVIELAQAQHAGLPLDAESALAARDVVEREIDAIAWNGDSESGLVGFLNNPDIPVGNVPNGAGGFPEWSTKTPEEILLDGLNIFNEISENSNGVEFADTWVLPISQYNLLKQPRSGFSDTSLIKWLADNIPELQGDVNNIKWSPVLAGAGTGGSDVMVAYKRDPRKLSMLLPMDILVETPQLTDLRWKTIVRAATGSVIVRYPLSVNIKEQI